MKIICIARNYSAHATEMNNPRPVQPVFFLKPDSSLLLNNRPFFYPDFSTDIQYETEVVIKISRLGKNISTRFAGRYFNEVALGIDFTARDLQRKCIGEGLPWEIAKGFDQAAVLSRFINKNEMPVNIVFHLDVNGKTVQQGNTADMLFSFNELISYLSGYMTLKIGDLIYTGTPAGVGTVKINDRLEGYIGEKKMLDFIIK